jgi:hypothetical protein
MERLAFNSREIVQLVLAWTAARMKSPCFARGASASQPHPSFRLRGHDADLRLQKIYNDQSELVVVCVAERYGGKPWTLAEHEVIRARLMQIRSSQEQRDKLRILPIRVGEGEVAGIYFNTIVPDVRTRSETETAKLILDRLSLISAPSLVNPVPPQTPPRKKKMPLAAIILVFILLIGGGAPSISVCITNRRGRR